MCKMFMTFHKMTPAFGHIFYNPLVGQEGSSLISDAHLQLPVSISQKMSTSVCLKIPYPRLSEYIP